MSESAQISFYTHSLSGLARMRQDPSTDPSRVSLGVQAKFATEPDGPAAHTVDIDLAMYAPQDITGFDARHVIRQEPAPATQDFESIYLPFIEFDRPELPWLFSLHEASSSQTRPWLCLLVVPVHESVTLSHSPEFPNPVLRLSDIPALTGWALPDLADSSWWAHVQLSGQMPGTPPANPSSLVMDDPSKACSRILCPIKLEPGTAYTAYLVPTYRGGVLAGLGEPLDGEQLEANAWSTSDTSLKIPVYHHWSFKTGYDGDFEKLARRVQPRQLLEAGDGRDMSVDPPQFQEAIAPTATLWQTRHEGTLKASDTPAEPLDADVRDAYQALLDDAVTLTTSEPRIKPPLYGRWQAGTTSLDSSQPGWLDELNTDPRLRVMAGAARRIVQSQQEALMRSAWDQAEAVQEVNALLNRAQLARQTSKDTHARLSNLPPTALAQITAPQHDRIWGEDGDAAGYTTGQNVRGDRTLNTVTSPAFRRFTRQNSPWLQQSTVNTSLEGVANRLHSNGLATDPVNPTGELAVPDVDAPARRSGMQTPITYTVSNTQVTFSGAVTRTAVKNHFRDDVLAPLANEVDPNDNTNVSTALYAHLSTIYLNESSTFEEPEPWPEETLADRLKPAIIAQLDPEKTLPDVVDICVTRPVDTISARDHLEPIVVGPVFDQPMYRELKDYDLGFFFPGMDRIKEDTLGLIQVNPSLIEAFMVGLNHEMSRELLWRGYPCDMRATYFRQFWDISGYLPAPTNKAEREALYDLQNPIHTWGAQDALGTHLKPQADVVMVIRGEVLRRFPDTWVYLIPAEWREEPDGEGGFISFRRPVLFTPPSTTSNANPEIDSSGQPNLIKLASFRGYVDPDITLLGFDLTAEQVKGSNDPAAQDPGYFVVLQEPPMSIRFGLDSSDTPEDPLVSWDNATWEHLDLSTAPYITSVPPSVSSLPSGPDDAVWAQDSSHMADILYQRPLRLAIHADALLP